MSAYALHLGLYPIDNIPASVDGHTDPTVEKELFDPRGWVSGSWKCWGPEDQATDGDESLHLVFPLRGLPAAGEDVGLVIERFIEVALNHTDVEGRLLDYAVITTEVWSEVTHVVTFTPGGGRNGIAYATREGLQ